MKNSLTTDCNMNNIVIKMDEKKSNIFYIYLENILLFSININDYYDSIPVSMNLSDSNKNYLVLCSISRLWGLQYNFREESNNAVKKF